MADPLATVLRLRRLALDQSRSALAQALRDAEMAEAAHAQAMNRLVQEARQAPADAAHALSGRFAAWLPAARMAIAEAETQCARRNEATEAARLAMATAHAELEAATTLSDQRAQAAGLEEGRQTQRRLDELACRSSG